MTATLANYLEERRSSDKFLKTNRPSVPTTGLASVSALRSDSFSNLGSISMGPSAVLQTAGQGNQRDTGMIAAATLPSAK